MTTTTETTAERLERIREGLAYCTAKHDITWLCDTLQGLLDERERVDRYLVNLRTALRGLQASLGPADHSPDAGEKVEAQL